MPSDKFIKSISTEFSQKFKALEVENKELQIESFFGFYGYFAKVLNCFRLFAS